MSTTDNDTTLFFHRKHTPPPSVILLTIPSNKTRDYHTIPSNEQQSYQQKKHQSPPHMIGLHVNNLEIHDTSNASYGWQRSSDKNGQLTLAPDVAYRYTYLEEIKQEKPNINNGQTHSCSLSPRSQQSAQLKFNNSHSHFPFELSQQKYSPKHSTIYDYIRTSIREMERRRNLRQQNISSRVKRPQNEDSTFRRVLGEKKSAMRTSVSRSSTTIAQSTPSLFNNDLRSPQSFVNYINYSRVLHSTTSN